jgi:hypothetical protein
MKTLFTVACYCGVAFVTVGCSMSTNSVAQSSNKTESETSGLQSKIKRPYKETELHNLYHGITAMPQYIMLESKTVNFVFYVLGRGIRPAETALADDKRTVKDGFEVGKVVFQDNDLAGEFVFYCGTRFVQGKVETPTFEAIEAYLTTNLLKPPKKSAVFAEGSFTGKPLGEMAWHYADEETGDYRLVWLRGLTIVQIRLTLKDEKIKKDAKEKIDARAVDLDKWIVEHTLPRH